MWQYNQTNELYHYGTKGQKWGVRNYQNEDGSLTPEGRIHYGYGEAKLERNKAKDKLNNAKREYKKVKEYQRYRDRRYDIFGRFTKEGRRTNEEYKEKKAEYKQAKKDYKKEIEDINRESVKKYKEASKKAYELGEKGDALYDKANATKDKAKKEAYIKEAKKYYEQMDEEWKNSKVDEAYKATGKNAFDRLINNIKYRK